jgi:hypothetical protein
MLSNIPSTPFAPQHSISFVSFDIFDIPTRRRNLIIHFSDTEVNIPPINIVTNTSNIPFPIINVPNIPIA